MKIFTYTAVHEEIACCVRGQNQGLPDLVSSEIRVIE